MCHHSGWRAISESLWSEQTLNKYLLSEETQQKHTYEVRERRGGKKFKKLFKAKMAGVGPGSCPIG